MRTRIAALVATTTSAVVVAFIVPLCLLVSSFAYDRASASAQVRARSMATVAATVSDPVTLRNAVVAAATDDGQSVSLLLPSGQVLGPPLSAPHLALARQAQAERRAFTARADGGVDAVVPVQAKGGIRVVLASAPEAVTRAGVGRAWASIIGLGLMLIALSVALARWLGRRISTPVTSMALVANRLREGDFSARADLRGPQETAELGSALNALADRLVTLVSADREHAADLAHRLRSPLTALRLDADAVTDPQTAQRLREHVDALAAHIDSVVRDARREVQQVLPQPCDLVAVVAERAAHWQPLAEDQARPYQVRLPGQAIQVSAPREVVAEVIDTLLDNVFAHTPEGAGLLISVTDQPVPTFTLTDGGPGIAAGYSGRGDSTSGSTGLGLDIVRRLARTYGGTSQIAALATGGTRAEVTWQPYQPRTP